MPINSKGTKANSPTTKIQDVPNPPVVGTPTIGPETVVVPFTPATTGGNAYQYRVTSTPAGFETLTPTSPATFSPSTGNPITPGVAYTFAVKGETNTAASAGYSSSSSSITPVASYELISTTVMTGNTNTMLFSSIPSFYKHLQIRVVARNAEAITGLRGFFMNLNGDYATTCATHYLYANAASIISGYQSDTRINAGGWSFMTTANLTAGSYFSGIIDILDYSNTTKNKVIRLSGGATTTTAATVGLLSGLWPSTSAVNSIEMYSNGAWVSGTRFSLYGIRG